MGMRPRSFKGPGLALSSGDAVKPIEAEVLHVLSWALPGLWGWESAFEIDAS